MIKYLSMTYDVSLLHLLRALKRCHFSMKMFWISMKTSISKLLNRFSQNMVFRSEKLKSLPHDSRYNQYSFYCKALNESKLLSHQIFVVGSWIEIIGIGCRGDHIFFSSF